MSIPESALGDLSSLSLTNSSSRTPSTAKKKKKTPLCSLFLQLNEYPHKISPLTCSTTLIPIIHHPFQNESHLNHHHGEVVVSLAMRPMQLSMEVVHHSPKTKCYLAPPQMLHKGGRTKIKIHK